MTQSYLNGYSTAKLFHYLINREEKLSEAQIKADALKIDDFEEHPEKGLDIMTEYEKFVVETLNLAKYPMFMMDGAEGAIGFDHLGNKTQREMILAKEIHLRHKDLKYGLSVPLNLIVGNDLNESKLKTLKIAGKGQFKLFQRNWFKLPLYFQIRAYKKRKEREYDTKIRLFYYYNNLGTLREIWSRIKPLSIIGADKAFLLLFHFQYGRFRHKRAEIVPYLKRWFGKQFKIEKRDKINFFKSFHGSQKDISTISVIEMTKKIKEA